MIPPELAATEESQERRWYYHAFRQAFGRNGSGYALARTPDNRWVVEVILPDGTKRRLGGASDFEAGLRLQDYCTRHDTIVKIALIELDRNGNFDPMEKILEDGQVFGELPKRRVRLTLDVEVHMRGTDEEIKNYILLHMRGATGVAGAAVTDLTGPRLEEPRPRLES